MTFPCGLVLQAETAVPVHATVAGGGGGGAGVGGSRIVSGAGLGIGKTDGIFGKFLIGFMIGFGHLILLTLPSELFTSCAGAFPIVLRVLAIPSPLSFLKS